MRRSFSSTISQTSSAAIWRQPTRRGVLRLPGFANHKLPEGFIVQARQESDAVYTLRDFTIDDDSPETQRHLGDHGQRERKVRGGHKANPNTIGHTPNAPSPAATIRSGNSAYRRLSLGRQR